ncbi:molybdopterin oxidoreductase [Clostridiales bacterium PH28_bin88]|nr:molybdopterin oxidoreductase [Clostridiales bacterium PH28_bin88]
MNAGTPRPGTGANFRSTYIILFALVAAGLYAIGVRVTGGLEATGLTSITSWGAWVAFYIYFVGLSAGAFLLSTLIYVFGMHRFEKIGREALLVSLISMMVALCFILLDLGRMDRFAYALWFGNATSILAWEVRFYLAYILLLAAELYYSMRPDLVRLSRESSLRGRLAAVLTRNNGDLSEASRQRDRRILKVLGSLGIPLATLGVHGGTGTLFAVVKAQPYWNSALFPIIFVVSALVSGTALLMVLHTFRCRRQGREVDLSLVQGLGMLLLGFLAMDLMLEFYEFLIGAYRLEAAEWVTLASLFSGRYAWSFWGIQMGLGALVPVMILVRGSKNSAGTLNLAALLVLVGILAVRFHIVLPPLALPQLPGLPWGHYSPTWVEWVSSTGLVALGMLMYLLGTAVLPVDDTTDDTTKEKRSMVHG